MWLCPAEGRAQYGDPEDGRGGVNMGVCRPPTHPAASRLFAVRNPEETGNSTEQGCCLGTEAPGMGVAAC